MKALVVVVVFVSFVGCDLFAGGTASCDTTKTSASCVEVIADDVVQKNQLRALCEVALGTYAASTCPRTNVVAGCRYDATGEDGKVRVGTTWYYPQATLVPDTKFTLETARTECMKVADDTRKNPVLIDVNGSAL